MQHMPLALITVLSGIATALLIVFFARQAPRFGLIDHPGGRKVHDTPIPTVGGLAMFVGFVPFSFTSAHTTAISLIFALAVLAAVGSIDDRAQLSARFRFVAELAAAAILIAHGDYARYLGDLFAWKPLYLDAFIGSAFTIVCYIGVTNAINMSDGLDGLAGTLSYVAVAWFTAVALVTGEKAIAVVGATTLGCLIGFLAFNLRTPWRRRASVFMGDAGSMVLGFLLAWFAIELAGERPSGLLTPIGAVWILAVPLLDMGSVMLYRIRSGRSPFSADRLHIHYILVDRGIPVGQVVMIQGAAGLLAGALGIGFPFLGIAEWAMFYGFVALWAFTYQWIAHAHRASAVQRDALARG